MSNLEERVSKLEERQSKHEQQIQFLQNEVKTMTDNMRWLRGLVHEQVALTEQTSGLMVEHITSLDGRMNEIGGIFTNRIKNQIEKVTGEGVITRLTEMEQQFSTFESRLKDLRASDVGED